MPSCRVLADFETDGHKKCVLHKARAKRVEPLMRQLNRQAWPDAYRALLLDIAGAYREIADIKFEEKRPHEKVRCHMRLQKDAESRTVCTVLNTKLGGMQPADSCCSRGGPSIL